LPLGGRPTRAFADGGVKSFAINVVVSEAAMKRVPLGVTRCDQLHSSFFSPPAGQIVSAEILMASEQGCPIEMHKIKIEACDGMYDKSCEGDIYMPFHRASYDTKTGQSPNSPREQVRRLESVSCHF